MSYKLVVHRAVYRDILSGRWVTLLELVPGSSISPASFRADMFMRMRILYIGAPSQRHRSDVAAPSQRHQSDVAATSQRHHSDIGTTSQRHSSDVAATSQRHRRDIGPTSLPHVGNALLGHHRNPLRRRCSAIVATSERRRSAIAATSDRRRCCAMSGMPFSALET